MNNFDPSLTLYVDLTENTFYLPEKKGEKMDQQQEKNLIIQQIASESLSDRAAE